MKRRLHSPQFIRECLMRISAVMLLVGMLLWGGTRDVLAAETNIADLLSNPALYSDLLRTNPAMVEAIVKKGKDKYDQAVFSGQRTVPYVREFNELFTNHIEVISYYTGQVGQQSWGSMSGFYGRYVVKMHLSIELEGARTNIVSTGVPTFYLYELQKITFRTNGSPGVQVHQIKTFSADDWRRLVEAKGDFGVLGITIETNKPVEGFEVTWRGFW